MAGRVLDYRIALHAGELEIIYWDSARGIDVFVTIGLDAPCRVRVLDDERPTTVGDAFTVIGRVLRGLEP